MLKVNLGKIHLVSYLLVGEEDDLLAAVTPAGEYRGISFLAELGPPLSRVSTLGDNSRRLGD